MRLHLAAFLQFLLVASVCPEHLTLKVVVSEPNMVMKISCINESIVIKTLMEPVAEESYPSLMQSLFEIFLIATVLYCSPFWKIYCHFSSRVIDRILNIRAAKPQRKMGNVDVTHWATEQGKYVILRSLKTPVETEDDYETADEDENNEENSNSDSEQETVYYRSEVLLQVTSV